MKPAMKGTFSGDLRKKRQEITFPANHYYLTVVSQYRAMYFQLYMNGFGRVRDSLIGVVLSKENNKNMKKPRAKVGPLPVTSRVK